MIQNITLWIPGFFTIALKYVSIPFNREVKHGAQISLHSFYTSNSRHNSKECLPMFKNYHSQRLPCKPAKHTYLSPLCAALAHLPLACSALHAHVSAYTKQQHEDATVSTSTTIQERGQRHSPGPSHRWRNWQKPMHKYQLTTLPISSEREDTQATTEEFVEL